MERDAKGGAGGKGGAKLASPSFPGHLMLAGSRAFPLPRFTSPRSTSPRSPRPASEIDSQQC